jgi:hypothetical protein
MIKVQVEVRSDISSFIVAVRAETLLRAVRIAQDRYPGSAVEIPFPIEPDGFFVAEPHHDGRLDPETVEVVGKVENSLELDSPGTGFPLCTKPSLKARSVTSRGRPWMKASDVGG